MNPSSQQDTSYIAMTWCEFQRVHQTRSSLLVHCLMVPVFAIGVIAGFYLTLNNGIAVGWPYFALALVSFAAQGISHKTLERNALPPMTGLLEIPRRFLIEQYLSWPRALLSGTIVRLWNSESQA